ncbi:MAG: hypothetical protein JSV36_17245 [Anaerolineae bacterium]|nr:MAG: hypothetical protein JSV36_17245 [Anaerolineae bacterium]
MRCFWEEGEQVLRRALGEYAGCEAGRLNEDQLARGWEIHGSALWPVAGYATATGQAVYDAWREVEGDETPLGRIYFEEIHRPV